MCLTGVFCFQMISKIVCLTGVFCFQVISKIVCLTGVFCFQVISKKLAFDHLPVFIDVLQVGLLDSQSHSSSGACVVLNGVMKTRGGEISRQVRHISQPTAPRGRVSY